MDWSSRARDLISRRVTPKLGEEPVLVKFSSLQFRGDYIGYMVSEGPINGKERERGVQAFYLNRSMMDPRLGQQIIRQSPGILEIHSFEPIHKYVDNPRHSGSESLNFYGVLISIEGTNFLVPPIEKSSPPKRGPTYVKGPFLKPRKRSVA